MVKVNLYKQQFSEAKKLIVENASLTKLRILINLLNTESM